MLFVTSITVHPLHFKIVRKKRHASRIVGHFSSLGGAERRVGDGGEGQGGGRGGKGCGQNQ